MAPQGGLLVAAFTLDYWTDDGWYVGKLREVPGIFSQGKTLEELKLNIKDALELVLEEDAPPSVPDYKSIELQVEVT